jgi:hypothetical protein
MPAGLQRVMLLPWVLLQVALGPGGLHGPFSAAAATVLSKLRSSADMLCGLLQLLLSDAAVDWSVDREAHAARKDQDTAVGLRLCASRCAAAAGLRFARYGSSSLMSHVSRLPCTLLAWYGMDTSSHRLLSW